MSKVYPAKISDIINVIFDIYIILFWRLTAINFYFFRFLYTVLVDRDTISKNVHGKRGAILTTHSMEEADALSSRVGIMVKGELRYVLAIYTS